MAECQCLSGCPFFNDKMQNMPSMAGMIKEKYCLGDNTACARYMVFKTLGREKVPPDLYPAQGDRAKQILSV